MSDLDLYIGISKLKSGYIWEGCKCSFILQFLAYTLSPKVSKLAAFLFLFSNLIVAQKTSVRQAITWEAQGGQRAGGKSLKFHHHHLWVSM